MTYLKDGQARRVESLWVDLLCHSKNDTISTFLFYKRGYINKPYIHGLDDAELKSASPISRINVAYIPEQRVTHVMALDRKGEEDLRCGVNTN